MAQDRETVRRVAWQELFPLLHLFSALRMAVGFRMLVLAAIAIVGTAAGWRVLGDMFDNTDNVTLQNEITVNSTWPWEEALLPATIDNFLSPDYWQRTSPLVRAWNKIAEPFEKIYRADVSLVQWTYWLSCALWSLIVWAFFGGAITRIAAVKFARQENLAWGKVAGFVRPHWGSYFAAPLMPIGATFLAAVLPGLVGLLMHSDAGLLVVGIVWPLVLLAGFVIAFLLIGLYFCWPLMWATISVEGTDAFGAINHAYSYVYQRPLRYLLYAVLAALMGVLGWFFVSLFAEQIIALSQWSVSWGSGSANVAAATDGHEMSRFGEAGVTLIQFWNNCVRTLALAFVFSYFWVSTTVIYFLLRRLVDATELDEVFLPEDYELHGLPPLKTGADGVVEPADDEAGTDGSRRDET